MLKGMTDVGDQGLGSCFILKRFKLARGGGCVDKCRAARRIESTSTSLEVIR